MEPATCGIIASVLYLGASTIRFLQLRNLLLGQRVMLLTTVAMAVTFHFFSLYGEIFTESGINLRIQVMGSLIALVITVIILLNSLRLPIDNLFLLVLPLVVLFVLTSHYGNSFYVPRKNLSSGILAHIIFSVLAYSILSVAACQAIILFIQDYSLRHSKFPVIRTLPPLQTMELLLFQFLSVGLILLTLSIITGFLFLENLSAQRLVHHTVITIGAWLVFAILVWGRLQSGWRGAKAAEWTLAGFALLLVGYFGSKLVIEVIL